MRSDNTTITKRNLHSEVCCQLECRGLLQCLNGGALLATGVQVLCFHTRVWKIPRREVHQTFANLGFVLKDATTLSPGFVSLYDNAIFFFTVRDVIQE